jgi:uncharacterized repeat protein (TIGR02543 family)
VIVAQEVIPATGHTWNSGEITTVSTCTTDGVKTYTCTTCGETKTEAISAVGHTVVTDPAVDPTCTENGLTEGSHCSVCNEVIVAQEVIPATGHTEVVDEAVDPTASTAGKTAGSHCSVCGTVLVEQKNVYAITYELNRGTNRAENPTTYTAGDKAVTLENPTRKGYTFQGWYTESTFENQVTEINEEISGNLTLYAQWTANTYTIKYNGNGSTSGTMSSSTKTYGKTSALKANAFTRTGYLCRMEHSERRFWNCVCG